MRRTQGASLFRIFFSTFTLLSSATPRPKGLDIQTSINNPKDITINEPQMQENFNTINTIDFDDLEEGQFLNDYDGFQWPESIRVSKAGCIAASQPMAALVNQYTSDNVLTHPYIKVSNDSTWKVFDLHSFYISPAYEPQTHPRIEFNITVVGFGIKEEDVTARIFKVGGGNSGGYPVKITLLDFYGIEKFEVSLTSQIAPDGGPFQPPYFIDNIEVERWGPRDPNCGRGRREGG